MWIAENWKDYEVLDTSKGENWNAGRLYSGSSGPAGYLGYSENTERLETPECTLSSQQTRRR